MKNILLVAEDNERLQWWKRIITYAAVNIRLEVVMAGELSLEYLISNKAVIENTDVVIFATDGEIFGNGQHKSIYNWFEGKNIPIVVTEEEAKQFRSIPELLTAGVRGIIGVQLSIITLSEVLRIVAAGGIYLRPAN